MLPSEELKLLKDKTDRIIAEQVLNLYREFIKVSPVDTGAFRSAWTFDQISDNEWIISNGMQYASILYDGRRLVAGKWFGSEQWRDGGDPMLKEFNQKLERMLKDVRV